MFSLVCSLTCRFWSTYSSISVLAAFAANFGSTESNETSTRRLPRTGSTLTRPMNALTSADSSGGAAAFGASGAGTSCRQSSARKRRLRSFISDTGVAGGVSVPLNSGTWPSSSLATTRLVRSRPLRILYCVW